MKKEKIQQTLLVAVHLKLEMLCLKDYHLLHLKQVCIPLYFVFVEESMFFLAETYSPSNSPPYRLHFDFLGKDSIRYDREVDVAKEAYNALEDFVYDPAQKGSAGKPRKKRSTELLFEQYALQFIIPHIL